MESAYRLIHRRPSNCYNIASLLCPLREDCRCPITAHGAVGGQSLHLFRMGKEAKHIAKRFAIKGPIQSHDHHMNIQLIHPSRDMVKEIRKELALVNGHHTIFP